MLVPSSCIFPRSHFSKRRLLSQNQLAQVPTQYKLWAFATSPLCENTVFLGIILNTVSLAMKVGKHFKHNLSTFLHRCISSLSGTPTCWTTSICSSHSSSSASSCSNLELSGSRTISRILGTASISSSLSAHSSILDLHSLHLTQRFNQQS